MGFTRRLSGLALLVAAACSHGDKQAGPTSPIVPVVPSDSLVVTSPTSLIQNGCAAVDSVHLIAKGTTGTGLYRDNALIATDSVYDRWLAFTDKTQTFELRTPRGKTYSFTLSGKALPVPTIAFNASSMPEDTIGGAHARLTQSVPVDLANAVLVSGSIRVPTTSSISTILLASDPDSTKTKQYSFAIQGTTQCLAGPRTIQSLSANAIVTAAVPQSVVDSTNYALVDYDFLAQYSLNANSGSPGANTMRIIANTDTLAAVDGAIAARFNRMTKRDSTKAVQAKVTHAPSGRSRTSTLGIHAYLMPAAIVTYSQASGLYTMHRSVPPSSIGDVVKDKNLTIPVVYFNGTDSIATKFVYAKDSLQTFSLPRVADHVEVRVPHANNATVNNLLYVKNTVQIQRLP